MDDQVVYPLTVDKVDEDDPKIRLLTVNELRMEKDNPDQPNQYYVPAYQRGYRWNPTQVTQLLDDIRDFMMRKDPQPEEYYCLQPLVLLKKDNCYEVVDGQQRLTTLLLILRHFNARLAVKYQMTLYSITYATRPQMHAFLEHPTEELAKKYIDYYFIWQAMQAIEKWFAARENEVDGFKDTFLNRVKVIRYKLSAHENPVAAFTRLNVGKIPLTNGELIRALFLFSTPGDSAGVQRLRIAYEWDMVEKSLQDPAFWAFLSNNIEQNGGRIDFLFELAARQQGMTPDGDKYATFNHFNQKLSDKDADRAKAWLDIKNIYMLLAEWFDDRRLFHLVGFLIWDGMDVNDLRTMTASSRKCDLKEKLRTKAIERAFRSAPPGEDETWQEWISKGLDNLTYPRDRRRIKAILLLFNLATLLQHSQSNIRFHFEGFKTARWDIEHVRSVASAELGSPTQQTEWLTHTLHYLKLAGQDADSTKLQAQIESHLALPPKAGMAAFEALYSVVLSHFHENDETEPDNGIANLALLDQETNRSYKNAVFPVKRQRVIELDEHGVFVPHCTRNVFMKCYSPTVDHAMFWTQPDRDGYRQTLGDTLHTFITGDWINE